MTAFSVGPVPVPLPGAAGAVVPIAAATAAGTIELAAVQQGALLPLHLAPSASLAAHPAPVQGLRWLADQQLLRPALRAELLQATLAAVPLSADEQTQALQAFAQQQGLSDAAALEAYRTRHLLSPAALRQLAEQPLRLQRHCAFGEVWAVCGSTAEVRGACRGAGCRVLYCVHGG